MPRQFVTWHTAQTPHGPCSWAVVDGLLHVRSALAHEAARSHSPMLAALPPSFCHTVMVSYSNPPSRKNWLPPAIEVGARRDLAVVRRSLEQLAAKQDQMAQNIATLQAAEQDIRQKMSSPPASRAAPPRKPPQPAARSPAAQSSSVPSPSPPAQPPLPPR